MELLRWKARLAVFWVAMAIGHSAGMFLMLLMPGVIEDIIVGEMEGMPLGEGMMVVYGLFWMIPLIVAVLCLTLNGSANRWMNFVLGIIWGLFFIFQIVGHAAGGEAMSVALWLLFIAGLVFAFFIAWFAWKWPKQEA
jgi:hypothetical protein